VKLKKMAKGKSAKRLEENLQQVKKEVNVQKRREESGVTGGEKYS